MNNKEFINKLLLQARAAALTVKDEEKGIEIQKGAYGDTTLKIDQIVESEIINFVKTNRPKSRIVAEESGIIGDKSNEEIILIDPIDGSTNAKNGIPFYSTAIAISDGEYFDDIIASGVIDLIRGEIIYCDKDNGVTVNGEKAKFRQVNNIEKAVIAFNSRIGFNSDSRIERGMDNLIKMSKNSRLLGSSALETAYIAIGRTDAFIEPMPRLRTFDIFPSLFMLKEAGGTFEFLNETELLISGTDKYSYVAANNEELCSKLSSLFRS
tara:strand:- start:1460 stop:2260 length:801 start_codon:yes stop_codon:yes gene_type:complete